MSVTDVSRPVALAVLLVALTACANTEGSPQHASRTVPFVEESDVPKVPSPSPSPSPSPQSSPRPSPSQRAGCRYAFPVQPPSVTHYVAAHHDYPATDIFAPKGTDVVAATDGVIDWVSFEDTWVASINDPATRGGLSVAIVGDDGIRYYGSHLLDVAGGIKPGIRVKVGQLLGHVDSTGDAKGIAPHLHFGISHPTQPDDWQTRRGEVRPYEYLNEWREGKMTTPVVPGALPNHCKA